MLVKSKAFVCLLVHHSTPDNYRCVTCIAGVYLHQIPQQPELLRVYPVEPVTEKAEWPDPMLGALYSTGCLGRSSCLRVSYSYATLLLPYAFLGDHCHECPSVLEDASSGLLGE